MTLSFVKFQGTGNDFILIDARSTKRIHLSSNQISQLCDRRFGIGADGLILILDHPTLDFEMNYFNSDGSRSFCGNGARCALQFSHELGLFQNTASFKAIDGIHEGEIIKDLVALKMLDVSAIEKDGEAFVLDTGSPHFIEFVPDLSHENIVKRGKEIRYAERYCKEGINVNLAEITGENQLKILTYERGVEDETYSCGTGATAVALAYAYQHGINDFSIHIAVKGGDLTIKGQKGDTAFTNICLIGPAQRVFEGTIQIEP